jgi:hypothetical protein
VPSQKPEAALRAMRSDVRDFVTYLRNKHVLDETGSLFAIGDALEKAQKTAAGLDWRYKSGRFVLRLLPDAIEWPKEPTSLVCSIEFEVRGTVAVGKDSRLADFDWNISWSQIQVEFTARSKSLGDGWSQFWHFDTHDDQPGKPIPNEAHPRFHLHHGGKAMKARREVEGNCWGQTLELNGPRFAHPPMDLILALDFVLSNTTGPRWRQEFLRDKDYTSAVRNSQRRFWRPHQALLSDYYGCGHLAQKAHPARLLVPTLLADET